MITKEEKLQEIEKFKARHLESVKKLIVQQGGLEPMISILVYRESSKQFGVVNFMVPAELMGSDAGKDLLANLAPYLFELLTKQNLIPVCFSWSSEAWLRKAPIDENFDRDKILENWQDLPKEEALMTCFESEYGSDLDCRLIIRHGKMVNENGDLRDSIELKQDEYLEAQKAKGPVTSEGRFVNLFKEYWEKKGKE